MRPATRVSMKHFQWDVDTIVHVRTMVNRLLGKPSSYHEPVRVSIQKIATLPTMVIVIERRQLWYVKRNIFQHGNPD